MYLQHLTPGIRKRKAQATNSLETHDEDAAVGSALRSKTRTLKQGKPLCFDAYTKTPKFSKNLLASEVEARNLVLWKVNLTHL